MWVLGRLFSSAGAASQRRFSLSLASRRDHLALGGCQAVSGGNVAPQHSEGHAGKERECGTGRDMAPRHDQVALGQARLDVPHVPHPVSSNHLAERRPGLKAPGCS